jgi:hypothetical protein
MTNLPQIDPRFLRHLSDETREEIARQTNDPYSIVAIKVGAYVGALLLVVVATHFASRYLGG